MKICSQSVHLYHAGIPFCNLGDMAAELEEQEQGGTTYGRQ